MTVTSWNGASGAWRNAADWSNGVPTASVQADFTIAGGYTVSLSRKDAFSVASVDFNAAGATLALQGTLTLGGIFDLAAGTLAMSKGGVLKGGTLMMDGGALVSRGGIGTRAGTLDGILLAGTLDLTAVAEHLNIRNGLNGVSGGPMAQIRLSGGEDNLVFAGSQTIDNVMITLDDQTTFSGLYTSQTLTVGANAIVTTTAFGPEAVLSGAKVVNDGAIISAASGAAGTFIIGLNSGFINNGAVSAASDMSINSPELINSAHGTITVDQDVSLSLSGGVANNGVLTLGSGASVDIASNTTISNAGSINVGSGRLSLDQSTGPGTVTFINTGAISIGQQGSLSLLLNFTVASLGNVVDAGSLYLGGTLDNSGATLQLGSGPIFGGTGATLGYGGLISGGTVVLGSAKLAYTGGGLANVTFQGALDLSAAKASVNLDGGVAITAAGGTGPGVVNLTGSGAALSFLDAPGVTANAIDNVTINAGGAHGVAAIDLSALSGSSLTLTLGAHASIVSKTAGAQVMLQGLFSGNYAVVNEGLIDAAAAGGGFTVSLATFENNGRITVANGDKFTLTGGLIGGGLLTIATGASAQLGVAAASQDVVFADATGALKLSSPAKFAALILGAAVGDQIDLVRTAATSASINAQDQLVITNNGAAVATLQLQGDYSHTTFNVGADGAGGSVITLAATPAVQGFAQAIAGLTAGGAVSAGFHAAAGPDQEQARLLSAPRAPLSSRSMLA